VAFCFSATRYLYRGIRPIGARTRHFRFDAFGVVYFCRRRTVFAPRRRLLFPSRISSSIIARSLPARGSSTAEPGVPRRVPPEQQSFFYPVRSTVLLLRFAASRLFVTVVFSPIRATPDTVLVVAISWLRFHSFDGPI